jgi:hypothetical protein
MLEKHIGRNMYFYRLLVMRETETETVTDRFSINRKPTEGRFSKRSVSVFPILVGVFFAPFFICFQFLRLRERERERERER